MTKQRIALAKSIIAFRGPFSAEDLYSKVESQGIDLVTVYRCLSAFTDLEILSTVNFEDGTQRYEYLCSSDKGHHHHIICKKCKKVDPINFCVVQGQEQLVEQMGYANVSHKLEFFGICKKCAN
ncbi:MAG: transcriptional repressor [Bdellovibrionales bacterium]|nr:transcriptional repressor [Bdellovibrionales bacterium]